MPTEEPVRSQYSDRTRERCNTNSDSHPKAPIMQVPAPSNGIGSFLRWNYLIAIKWAVLALILSLGSVYLVELLQTSFRAFSNKMSKNPDNEATSKNRMTFPLPKGQILWPVQQTPVGMHYIQQFLQKSSHYVGKELSDELESWLAENELKGYGGFFQEIGIVTLVSVVQLDEISRESPVDWSQIETKENSDLDQLLEKVKRRIPPQDRQRLKRASLILRQRLLLRLWLDDHGLIEFGAKLNSLGLNSVEDAYWLDDLKKLEQVLGVKALSMWTLAKESLPTGIEQLEALKANLWNRIITLDSQSIWNNWGTMLLVTLSVTGFGAMVSYCPSVLDPKKALLQLVPGKFSLASNCSVEFDWEDPVPVGQTCTIKVRRGGRPYPICDKDNILVEVRKDSQKVSLVTQFGDGEASDDGNLLLIRFSVRKAGVYSINLLAENNHVRGSPFNRTFLPDGIDPSKTVFLKQTSTVISLTGSAHKLLIEPRDSFGNPCRHQDFSLDGFKFVAKRIGCGDKIHEKETPCFVQFSHDNSKPSSGFGILSLHPAQVPNPGEAVQESGRVALTIRFPEPGVYHGSLTYEKEPISNGTFETLALTTTEAAAVQKNVAVKSPNTYYEGKLLGIGNEVQNKTRKVYVSVSSKQVVLKEYFLKVLPIRLATFRVSPNTKINFEGGNNDEDHPSVLAIDDGAQSPIKVMLKEPKIVVATFTHFLLRNIGGSETFHDKQEYFFKELRDFHRKRTRDKIMLKLTRENIIESTWKATKGLSANDWCRNFDISFAGEQGIDWGGLRREWFEKVSSKLFESGNPVGMFASFPESHLVHPNPNSKWKGKHYEMAGKIVGKCLYESSLGAAYRQLVKAKFTRSFLAQIIGLRVNYKYFEHDDPELFIRKVKFILENDVEGMELTFIEEEYEFGKLVKTVDLIPDGSKILVTNENKKNYLNALAQYRLCTKVKTGIESFIKGLNEIVPDDLLTIFDENELELLTCGTSEYSVTDLREHHVVCGSTEGYRKVLDWFWSIVGNMTEEEKGRLLQFTTGSSLLPPGGFKELSPLFQILFSPSSGTLPTAHTCFNQICIPDYDSYESFEKCLRIAINEGSEGFGLI